MNEQPSPSLSPPLSKVVLEPADHPWGDRMYCAVDPEGQFWMFAKRLAR